MPCENVLVKLCQYGHNPLHKRVRYNCNALELRPLPFLLRFDVKKYHVSYEVARHHLEVVDHQTQLLASLLDQGLQKFDELTDSSLMAHQVIDACQ